MPTLRLLSKQQYRVDAAKRYQGGFAILSRLSTQRTKQGALLKWNVIANQLSCQLATLDSLASRHRSNLLSQCLESWRGFTADAVNRRLRYFLMVIINRWRIYTEECIAERQQRYTALLHWAANLSRKAFVSLKLHSKQKNILSPTLGHSSISVYGSERKRTLAVNSDTAIHSNDRLPSSVMYALPNRSASFTRDSARLPFSISYRSPHTSMILNKTPDVASRLSVPSTNNSTRRFRTDDRSSLLNTSISPTTTTTTTTRTTKRVLIPLQTSNTTRGKGDYSSIRLADQQRLSSASTTNDASLLPSPSTTRESTGELRNRLTTSTFGLGTAAPSSTMVYTHHPGSRRPLEQNSTTFRGSDTTSCNRGSTFYDAVELTNTQMDDAPNSMRSSMLPSICIPYTNPLVVDPTANSVRDIMNFYRDRYEIATMLDGMVTRVEQTNAMNHQPYEHRPFGHYSSNRNSFFHYSNK